MLDLMYQRLTIADGSVVPTRKIGSAFWVRVADAPAVGSRVVYDGAEREVIRVECGRIAARLVTRPIPN